MRVLCVAPDLEELLTRCAGLVLRYAQSGQCDVTGIVAARGVAFEHTSDQMAIRVNSTPAADGNEIDTPDSREFLTRILRQADPDLVIGPSWCSNSAIALGLAEWLFNASYAATVPNFPVMGDPPPVKARPPMFAYDDPKAAEYLPSHYVDVGAVWKAKCELLDSAGMTSQDHALSDFHQLARFRGMQTQVDYAEAYARMMTWGRVRCGSLLP